MNLPFGTHNKPRHGSKFANYLKELEARGGPLSTNQGRGMATRMVINDSDPVDR